jgi:hypothetical protein
MRCILLQAREQDLTQLATELERREADAHARAQDADNRAAAASSQGAALSTLQADLRDREASLQRREAYVAEREAAAAVRERAAAAAAAAAAHPPQPVPCPTPQGAASGAAAAATTAAAEQTQRLTQHEAAMAARELAAAGAAATERERQLAEREAAVAARERDAAAPAAVDVAAADERERRLAEREAALAEWDREHAEGAPRSGRRRGGDPPFMVPDPHPQVRAMPRPSSAGRSVVREQLESVTGGFEGSTTRTPAVHRLAPFPPLSTAAAVTPPNLNHQTQQRGLASMEHGHGARHTIGDLQTLTRERLNGLRSPSPHSLVRCAHVLGLYASLLGEWCGNFVHRAMIPG